MNLALHRFELHCRRPFRIARGTTTAQPTLIVELEQDGVRGYGEAVECAYYGAAIERMAALIESLRPKLQGMEPDDPAVLWQRLRPALAECPFAQCALDAAAHDLWGKLLGRPVWQLWNLRAEDAPPSDYTLGIDPIDAMVEKLGEMPGFPAYKIKLGTPEDLDVVRALRRHTGAALRVDANGAWTPEQTIRFAAELKQLGVELIEQPLPPEQWEAMAEVHRLSALPILADESCRGEEDVARCVGRFHGINVKPPKCGGLTPARRMLLHARRLGLKTMVGCFTESSVGISAYAQLAPMADYADLDGALLLADDPAEGVRIDRGRIVYPQEAGCGVRLGRCAVGR